MELRRVGDATARRWPGIVRGNKQSMRKYLATRLISKLTGTARLLAMSWSQAEFDTEDGVTKYLRKLAQSPLVRRSMPNAAAIMSQYFSFKRYNNEKVADFLVREPWDLRSSKRRSSG